jgi:hypothetical protein
MLFVGDSVNVGLDISFDNMYDCKGIQEKAGEVNSPKNYVTSDKEC